MSACSQCGAPVRGAGGLRSSDVRSERVPASRGLRKLPLRRDVYRNGVLDQTCRVLLSLVHGPGRLPSTRARFISGLSFRDPTGTCGAPALACAPLATDAFANRGTHEYEPPDR